MIESTTVVAVTKTVLAMNNATGARVSAA